MVSKTDAIPSLMYSTIYWGSWIWKNYVILHINDMKANCIIVPAHQMEKMEHSFLTFLILRATLWKALLGSTDIFPCPPDWQLSKTKPNETDKTHKGSEVSVTSLILLMVALLSAESTISFCFLFENRMTLAYLVVFCCCCPGFF